MIDAAGEKGGSIWGNTSATLRKKATERWAGINGIERMIESTCFGGHLRSQLDREQSLGSALAESVLKSLSAVSGAPLFEANAMACSEKGRF